MRNSNIERHLKRLDAPTLPDNLRARCIATIPQAASAYAPKHIAPSASWKMQRLGVAGGLLVIAAIGSAFWSTQPDRNSNSHLSGSAAFAQTIEAMRNIEVFHLSRKSLNTEAKGGWHSQQWTQTEAWFDEEHGAYAKLSNNPYSTALLPKNYAKTTYSLMLPDGMCYERGDSNVVVEKKPAEWQKTKQQVMTMLLANVATTPTAISKSLYISMGSHLSIKSTQTALWKGQQAKLFIFEAKPSQDSYKSPGITKKVYVDVGTSRVIATQQFILFQDEPPLLVDQMEVDYSQPDPALFNPIKFLENTTRVPKSDPYVRP